ncbi:RIP metalloprotease RseP [bacterium]|nr:RIP metalloprotease RseP [bacterium]
MLISILSVIIVLGVLVFVHEFGHFIAAKFRGVRVLKFSLGFPPTMISKKIGETEYCLSWIPFGGYVKLAGEEVSEDEPKEPYMFGAKKIWERLLVMIAGPFMNVLLGFLVFWALFFFWGLPQPYYDYAKVGSVLPDSPALELGLREGDMITRINDQSVQTWEDMVGLVHPNPETKIYLEWARAGTTFADSLVTMEKTVSSGDSVIAVGLIGISPPTKTEELSLWGGFKKAGVTTWEILTLLFDFLFTAIKGRINLNEVGGPILIAQVAGQTARAGIVSFLFFLAALSINLALLNILPLPILDGGRILFLIIEAIKGKPIKFRTRMIALQIGFVIIVALMVFITINDILRLAVR